MTGESNVGAIPAAFARLPFAIVLLDEAGTVRETNGSLDLALGVELVGQPFPRWLDPGSREKFERMIVAAARGLPGPDAGVELILAGPEALLEPRRFSAAGDAAGGGFWLFEQRADPRLERLAEEVTGVNSDLARTQRDLLKQRGRLAHLNQELEEQYRNSERLSGVVREQNAELEGKNRKLVELTRELRRSNAALDDFAHVVSHDLKAPLRAVANYAAWIAEDLGEGLPPETAAHLGRMRANIDRMRTMIQGVLEYARAGRTLAPPEPVDTARLVAEVVGLLDPPPALAIDLGQDLPTIVTDRAPLHQVLLNLLSNAVKYAGGAGGRIQVNAVARGDSWEFSVSDDGPGIAVEARERIWTLFGTAQSTESEESSGIGLAVVKKIVEARGGSVWLESGGGGADFRFLWPTHATSDVS